MTKHVDDLRAEIARDPASDPPRLVLADHYEQEGDLDRATLIRAQIRRAGLPAWHPDVLKLDLNERAILARRGAEWRAELPAPGGVTWGPFRRGFVDGVAFAGLAAFTEHIAACVRAAPIQHVALPWPSGRPKKLDAIAQVRSLTLTGSLISASDFKWLAGSPLLSTVRALTLLDSDLRSGLPALLQSRYLGELEALRIPLHHLGNAGIAKLRTANLPKLAELELPAGDDEESFGSGGRRAAPAITHKGLVELLAWPQLAHLHTLDLSHAKLGSMGLRILLESPQTRSLTCLRIRNIKDGDWDMDDSLGAFKFGPAGTLHELDISENDLDPEGAHYVAESRALRELAVLRIANVRSKAFERLAKASWVRSLRVLTCSEPALPHFLKRTPERLHTLEIAEGAGLSAIVDHLAAAPPPALQSLDLRRAKLDQAGLEKLGRLALPGLLAVMLPRNRPINLDALKAFAASPLGERLVSLDAHPEVDRLPIPVGAAIGRGDYMGPCRYL